MIQLSCSWQKRSFKRATKYPGFTSRVFFFLLFLTVSCTPSLYQAATNLSSSSSNNSSVTPLQIIAIDVGQGDGTLIITPAGHTFLIDAGPVDAGYQSVLPLLAQMGINHLSALFASQYDADHIGGFAEVISGPDEILGTDDDLIPDTSYDRGFEKFNGGVVFENYLSAIGDTRTSFNAGDSLSFDNGITVTNLITNGVISDDQKLSLADDDENGHSMGLLITYGSFRYFTAGDLTGGGYSGSTKTVDLESVVAPLVNQVDILHVNHHGSDTSSSETYLETLQPQVALISLGNNNTYGHPTQNILTRLYNVGAEIYQTETGTGGFLAESHIANGSIFIEVDNEGNYTVNGDGY